MATVHEFPDSGERAWRKFEAHLRAMMASEGAASSMIDYVMSALKPVALQAYAVRVESMHPDPEVAIVQINDWIWNQGSLFLSVLAAREIELYALRGPG